jgi:hypothetical protein
MEKAKKELRKSGSNSDSGRMAIGRQRRRHKKAGEEEFFSLAPGDKIEGEVNGKIS